MKVMKLGTAALVANTYTDLSSGGVGQDCVVNVYVANKDNTSTPNVRVAVGVGSGSPSVPNPDEFIEYGTPISAPGMYERTGIPVANGEKVWVYVDQSNCSAAARGLSVV